MRIAIAAMDETLLTQDFRPPFASTGRPPASSASAELEAMEEADLLAAVDMVDEQCSGVVTRPGVNPQHSNQQHHRQQQEQHGGNESTTDEDWDDDALAKIAEIEQSICMVDDAYTSAGTTTGPARPVATVTAGASNEPTVPGRAATRSSVDTGDASTSIKGEVQVLRDRQATYERRILALQEQLQRKEEEAKIRPLQMKKDFEETLGKLTTQLQFKDQDLDEMRKSLTKMEHQRKQQTAVERKLHAGQLADGQAAGAKGDGVDFPTVSSFLSQDRSTEAGALKRPHSRAAEDETGAATLESPAKRVFSRSKSTSEYVSKPQPQAPSSNSGGGVPPLVAAPTKMAAERQALKSNLIATKRGCCSVSRRRYGSGGGGGGASGSLLDGLLCEPIVSEEVRQACRSVGMTSVDVLDILQLPTREQQLAMMSPSDAADHDRHCHAAGRPRVPSVTVATASPGGTAVASPSNPTTSSSAPAACVTTGLVQKLLRTSFRVSTPVDGEPAEMFDTSLSVIQSSSEAQQAVGLWLARMESLVAEVCADFSAALRPDLTPDLFPSSSSQLPAQLHAHQSSLATPSGTPATCRHGNASETPGKRSTQQQRRDHRQQQRAVRILCALDHLLWQSMDACLLVATALSGFTATTTTATMATTSTTSDAQSSSDSDHVAARSDVMTRGVATSSASGTPQHSARSSLQAAVTVTPHGVRVQPVAGYDTKSCKVVGGRMFVRGTLSPRIFVNKDQSQAPSVKPADRRSLRSPWQQPTASSGSPSSTGTATAGIGGGGGGADVVGVPLSPCVRVLYPSPLSQANATPASRGVGAATTVGEVSTATTTATTAAAQKAHLGAPEQRHMRRANIVVASRKSTPDSPAASGAVTTASSDAGAGAGAGADGSSAVPNRCQDWTAAADDSSVLLVAQRLRQHLIRLFSRAEVSLMAVQIVAGSVLATVSECVAPGCRIPAGRVSADVSVSLSEFVEEVFHSGALQTSLSHGNTLLRVQGLQVLLALASHPASLQLLCIPRGCILRLLYVSLADQNSERCAQLATSCILRLLTFHGNKALSLLLSRRCSCCPELLRSLVACLRHAVHEQLAFHNNRSAAHRHHHHHDVTSLPDTCTTPSGGRDCSAAEASSSAPSSSRLLLLRQAISIFHTLILTFDHAAAMAEHFGAETALTNSYTALVYQLRQIFERSEEVEKMEKTIEVTMLTSLWEFLSDCTGPNSSSTGSSGGDDAMATNA